MFEGIVVDVLLKYLGEYIKDLNKEQLKIGLFSGNVVLKDLEVKGEALDAFNLPVTVKKGVLGKLELRVPWKNLKNQPVVVLLDNIFILVEKQNQFGYDEQESARRSKNRKRKRLENYETASEIKEVKDDDKKAKSFSEKLVTKILDNLQILINKIHIRFEDEHEGRTFALGLTIDRISLQSTDDQWKPKFVETVTATIMKLVELSDLSIYMDTETKSLRGLTHTQFYDTFSKLIPTSQTLQGHHFLIRPISAWLKLSLANNRGKIDMNIPKATMTAALEELSLSLEEDQYHALLGLVESINFYVQETKYLKFRPKERPLKDPRAWWKYAGNVVIESIRDRLNRKSWMYLWKRSKLRNEYIQLYKSSSGVKWHPALTKAQAKRLEELDDQNTFEDIVFFRSLAKAELQQEAKNKNRRHEFKKMKRKTKKRGRIMSALFSSSKKDSVDSPGSTGSGASTKLDKDQKKKDKEQKKKEKEDKKREKEEKKKEAKTHRKGSLITSSTSSPLSAARLHMHASEIASPRLSLAGHPDSASEISDTSSYVTRSEIDSDEETSDNEAPDILLSPQEKQELYETIGFDQALSDVMDEKLPPEYIKMKMNIEVGRVAFSLVGKKPDNSVGPLAVFGINDILVSLEKRPENMLLNLTVDNIEATDMLVDNPKFSRLIARSKKNPPPRGAKAISNSNNNNNNNNADEKFIQFRFEKKPLDGHCDLAIYAKMSPLDIIVNASSVVRFYSFFRPPNPVAVWALAGKGKRQWSDIKKRTRHQLLDVLKDRNTIDLTVDARAPTIFIPADATQSNTVIAIADLGKILITSELPTSKKPQITEMETDEDHHPHESEFYDKFRFSVTGIRVLATTEDDQGWQNPTDDNYSLYDFVHTDVNLLLEKSINPMDTSLTQVKLSGDLPLLRVHFSTRKLDLVVQLANAVDAHLAPLKEMSGGFKTHSMLDEKDALAKVQKDILIEMLSGVDEDEKEELKQQILSQKKIEVKFSIDRVEVELCQTEEDDDKIIAKLCLVGLSLDLSKQMYNLHGEILVQGMQLQDFVTKTDDPKFKNLFYSSEHLDVQGQAPFIKGSFLKLDRFSPDFNGIFTILSFDLYNLYVAVNPPAINTIMGLVNDCIAATTQRVVTEPQSQSPPPIAHPSLVNINDDSKPKGPLQSKVKVDVTLVNTTILLNDEGTHLATFSISGIDGEIDVKENGTMSAVGGLSTILLVDETALSSKPHYEILTNDDLDGEPCVTFGYHKLLPPPPMSPTPDSLLPHARLDLGAKHLHFIIAQGFLIKIMTFALPFIAMAQGRAGPPQPPITSSLSRNNSVQRQKTYNTLVSPFQKKTKEVVKRVIPERRRTQLNIHAENLHAFMPESDVSRSGLTVLMDSANLFTTYSSVLAPVFDLGGLDEEEDENEKEVLVVVNKFDMGATGLGLQLVNVDEDREKQVIQMMEDIEVKMTMEFLFGEIPRPVQLPSKKISIEIPIMKMTTDPEKMALVFRGIMNTTNFSKLFAVFNPRRSAPHPPAVGFTPPASPVPGNRSNPPTPRGNTLTPSRSGTPSRHHLALLNRTVIKIDIVKETIEVRADYLGEVFAEVELTPISLLIDIKENRHVMVFGKLPHFEVFDIIPEVVDDYILDIRVFNLTFIFSKPRKETVTVEQKRGGDPIVEFVVSKKREQAAYVDLQVRPLYISIGVSFFSKMLAFIVPFSQSFKYKAPEIPEQANLIRVASSFSSRNPPSLLPRSDTRELARAKSSQAISSISPPPSPIPFSISNVVTPKAVRLNERTNSTSSLPILSPRAIPPASPRTPAGAGGAGAGAGVKQKSFFRLRVDNTVVLVLSPDAAGSLLLDVGTVQVFNEMPKTNPLKSSKPQDDEDDITAELHQEQQHQMRKLWVKTEKMNARVCDNLTSSDLLSGNFGSSYQGKCNYVLKNAQIDLCLEARENENDKTGTVPKRKIIIQSTELIFMMSPFDYNTLMSIADGILKNLVRKTKGATHVSSGADLLMTEIFIEIPDLQLAANTESNGIALFRLYLINFSMLLYASKTMKLDAIINSFNIIDTRPGICTEFSGIIHGKPDNDKPMLKFNLQRVPALGTLNISFSLDHLRMFANMFAFLDILDFFLPALTEKLLPNFTNKTKAAPSQKPPNRIISITADIHRVRLYVLSDFYKRTSGILVIKTNAALEFVDRNRDAKISLRLQNLHMGTVHHQISSQKASVLHSASVDFVMSNSQGTATSITLSLDTLPLFLSPQDVSTPSSSLFYVTHNIYYYY